MPIEMLPAILVPLLSLLPGTTWAPAVPVPPPAPTAPHDPTDALTRSNDHCGLAGEFHLRRGDWLLLDNGTLVLGRDRLAGGVLCLLAELGPDGELASPNLVDSWDSGRQVQMALHAPAPPGSDPWNPTQGGDGPRPATLPGDPLGLQRLLSHACGAADPGYAVSFTRPLDFLDRSTAFPPPAPRPADSVRFLMSSEFLDDEPHALLLHTLAIWTPLPGSPAGLTTNGQSVLPALVLPAGALAGPVLVPMGLPPWARADGRLRDHPLALRDASRTEGDLADRPSAVLSSEGWVFVPGADGGPGLGVMAPTASWALRRFARPPPGSAGALGSGDHERAAQLLLPQEFFAVALPDGRRNLVREGQTLLYVGRAGPARAFFERWRPRLSGPYGKWLPVGSAPPSTGGEPASPLDLDAADAWDTLDTLDTLDVNGRGAALGHDAGGSWLSVRGDPRTNLPLDLTVPDRVWGDAVFELQLQLRGLGPDDWAGLALRKLGSAHSFSAAGECLLVLLRPGAEVEEGTGAPPATRALRLVLQRRSQPYDANPPLPFERPDRLPDALRFTRMVSLPDPVSSSVTPPAPLGVAPARTPSVTPSVTPDVTPDGDGRDAAEPSWHRLRVRLVGSRVSAWVDPDTEYPELVGEAPLLDLDLAAESPLRPPPDRGHLALVARPGAGEVRVRGLRVEPLGEADASAPSAPGALNAEAQADAVHLSWSNPKDGDWRLTRVLVKTGPEPPRHARDGICIYAGRRHCALDPTARPGTLVSYAAFAMDHAGNASPAANLSGVRLPASTSPAGTTPPTAPAGGGEPSATGALHADLRLHTWQAFSARPLDQREQVLADQHLPLARPMAAMRTDAAGGFAARNGGAARLAPDLARVSPEQDAVMIFTAPTCGTLRLAGELALDRPHPLTPARVSLWLLKSGRGSPAPGWLAWRTDLTDQHSRASLPPLNLPVCPGDRLALRFAAAPRADSPLVILHQLDLRLTPFFPPKDDPCTH